MITKVTEKKIQLLLFFDWTIQMLFRMIIIILVVLIPSPLYCESISPLLEIHQQLQIPAEFISINQPEICDKNNLYDMINGEAVIHMEFGFTDALFVNYERKSDGVNLRIELYRMTDTGAAMGLLNLYAGHKVISPTLGGRMVSGEGWTSFQKGPIYGSILLQPATNEPFLLKNIVNSLFPHLPEVSEQIPVVITHFGSLATSENQLYFRGDTILGERVRILKKRIFDYVDGVVTTKNKKNIVHFKVADNKNMTKLIDSHLAEISKAKNWRIENSDEGWQVFSGEIELYGITTKENFITLKEIE
jgi:hypothetical protein